MQVNDKTWWNFEFSSGNWTTGISGIEQTAYFAELILNNLPAEVKECLSVPGLKILDWGCALGQAVDLYQGAFPKAKVTGLDFAENAINKARELFPRLDFRTKSLNDNDIFDAIITSNVLEHFSNPLEVMKEHMRCSTGYYIILVPYNQGRREGPIKDGCHFYSFTEDSFPVSLFGFVRQFIIRIPPVKPDMWCEDQLLVVYERG